MEKYFKAEIFNKENLGSVRTAFSSEDGSVWFVGRDVLDILGIKHAATAYKRLLADEKATATLDDVSANGTVQRRKMTLINESGLYILIMSSRKKEAIDFQRWISREVLPSIRKYGAYVMGQESMAPEEKDALLKQVEKLAKEKGVYKEDGDFWHERYNKLLDEYIEASETLVKSRKYVRKPNGGVKSVKKDAPEGFIVPLKSSEPTYIVDLKTRLIMSAPEEGKKYAIVEREYR